MGSSYKEGELEQLHKHLYDTLSCTIEVCNKLGLKYFIIAGTAIGAYFEGDLLAWDDDIDIGMERGDYERFLAEAESVIPKGYTLQTPLNEPNTPYYFAKVRKDGTRFEGEDELNLPIHHGIYIDIFPMDRTPDNKLLERVHRWGVRMVSNAFVATTIPLRDGGTIAKWLVTRAAKLVGKRRLYRWLAALQGAFTDCDTKYINIVKMPRDHIERSNVNPPELVKLGSMMVYAPRNLKQYLEWHYPRLRRVIPVEEQINHAPIRLNFNGDD